MQEKMQNNFLREVLSDSSLSYIIRNTPRQTRPYAVWHIAATPLCLLCKFIIAYTVRKSTQKTNTDRVVKRGKLKTTGKQIT